MSRFSTAAQTANVALSQYLIPDLANMVVEYCWTKNSECFFQESMVYGNYEIVKYWIMDDRRTWYWAYLIGLAYKYGYLKIIELIEKENKYPSNYAYIMHGAIHSDSVEIIKMGLKKISSAHPVLSNQNWNWILNAAHDQSDSEAIKYFVKDVDPTDIYKWKDKFKDALLQALLKV